MGRIIKPAIVLIAAGLFGYLVATTDGTLAEKATLVFGTICAPVVILVFSLAGIYGYFYWRTRRQMKEAQRWREQKIVIIGIMPMPKPTRQVTVFDPSGREVDRWEIA
jgi:nicotinamide riboside transporter PnuC